MIRKERSLSLAERLFLPAIAKGMLLTLRAAFRPRFTRQYPEEPLPKTPATRGQPRLVRRDDGAPQCVACGLCEYACPAYAITIDGGETERPIEREPKHFEIDMLRCILCGFCEEACPKDAIFMSQELEMAAYRREDHVLGLEQLLRPAAEFEERMRYVRGIHDRWQDTPLAPAAQEGSKALLDAAADGRVPDGLAVRDRTEALESPAGIPDRFLPEDRS